MGTKHTNERNKIWLLSCFLSSWCQNTGISLCVYHGVKIEILLLMLEARKKEDKFSALDFGCVRRARHKDSGEIMY